MINKKKFQVPLYGQRFTVVIYDDNKDLQEMVKDFNFSPSLEHFDGGVFTYKDHKYIVFNSDKKGYPTPGIIAHEAKHLVNSIFIDICHELDRWNDEPEAYLLGWIVNRIHKFKDSIK